MIREIDRELLVQGITVPVKHYQNKILNGDDRNTKELIAVSFSISKPLNKRDEMLSFIFKEEADRILLYCKQEHADRVSGEKLNPGHSWLIRQDMWQKFMVGDEQRFDYTYSERIFGMIPSVVKILAEDMHSRQAVMQIFDSRVDLGNAGGDTRIPCSLEYSFLIRNNRLYNIYHMRSNDYFGHFAIDIWLASEMLKYIHGLLLPYYPELLTGSLYYFANSLHAYNWDLSKWVVF